MISGEHILIIVGVLLVFGPRRIPQAAAALGKAARNFKDQLNGVIEPEYKRMTPSDDRTSDLDESDQKSKDSKGKNHAQ